MVLRRSAWCTTSLACAIACAEAALAQGDRAGTWAGVGGDASHTRIATHPPASLTTPAWTRTHDAQGNAITFIAQATPAVSPTLVFVPGSVRPAGGATQFRLFALRRSDGTIAWSTALPTPALALGPQTGPTFDRSRGVVYQCAGRFVVALDAATGTLLWQRELLGNIVNASPIVTDDLGSANRLFISDYYTAYPSPSIPTAAARLYAINIDPRDAIANPFDPGEIVWAGLLGNATGATPAYLPRREGGVGLVYAASMGGIFASGQGQTAPAQVLAFAAQAEPPAGGGMLSPLWATSNPDASVGFFGGVSIAPASPIDVANGQRSPMLRVASYAFYNGMDAGNTLVLDAVSGALLRETRTNRSSSIPLALADGRTLLSAGIAGSFGSAPSLVLLPPPTAIPPAVLWDSALATWVDSNANFTIEPGEFLALGGWNHQPAVARFAGKTVLLTGTIGSGAASGAPIAAQLSRVDLALAPTHAAFVQELTTLAGGSVALAGANLYSVGSGGLVAFGRVPHTFDVDASGVISIDDAHAWSRGVGQRDVNGDASVTPADLAALATLLRHDEQRQLAGGVR